MRPVKPTVRAAALAALVALLGAASIAGCGAKPRSDGATGAAGTSVAAGAAGSATGAAGVGDPTGAAGANPTGAAGAVVDPTGAAGMMGTVPSGAGGTVDQGRLFTDAALVTTPTDDAGAAPADASTGGPSDVGKTIPGDGNTSTCHVGGMTYLLVFTQNGGDVTMVVTATSCSAGMHTIQIRAGFSCDNAGTEGGVWDGNRGQGIPMLSCQNNKGTLTYMRSGADPTTSWTVGDHSTKTDVTLHPMSVDTSCGTFF
jgi:hypothetical protein